MTDSHQAPHPHPSTSHRTSALVTAALALSMALTGCMNASSMQTAQTLEPGEGRAFIGGGFTGGGSAGQDLIPYYIEGGYRRGLVEDLDVGLKVTILGSTSIDGKYRLLDLEGFALSAGLQLSGFQITSGTGDDQISSNIVDVMVPVYASYDILEWLSVYAVPKYIMRSTFGDVQETAFSHFYGSSAGVKLGETWGLLAEGTFLASSDTESVVQGNAALFWAMNLF